MAKVDFRQKAIDDLNRIWIYTFEKWSEKQADKYYSAIKTGCQEIGIHPELRQKYNEIRENLLGLKTGKHIIFYQQKSNGRIEIIRILHEQMDLKNRITE